MNTDMLENILLTQSQSRQVQAMNDTICKWLDKLGAVYYLDNGNIYATKGESEAFPCVVAHTDTVHNIVKKNAYDIFIRQKDNAYCAFDPRTNFYRGIGGDDKVGIFIALSALSTFDNIKVAFFRDEEIGCQGSRVADMTFFEDVAYVFQCDRQGYGDFVRDIYGYELFGDEFSSAISEVLKSYRYKEHEGALTDVYQLKRNGLGVAVANMSCGYYKPHSDTEFISIDDMTQTHNMVLELITTLGETKYEHKGKDRWDDDSYWNTVHWPTSGYFGMEDNDFDSAYNYKNVNGKWIKVWTGNRRHAPNSTTTSSVPAKVAGRTIHECPTCGTWCFWLNPNTGLPDCPACDEPFVKDVIDTQYQYLD